MKKQKTSRKPKASKGDRKQASLSTDQIDARLSQAKSLLQSGKLDQAEAIYKDLAPHCASNARYLNDRAALAYHRKDYSNAARLFDRSLAITPDVPQIIHNLSLAYQALGQFRQEAEALIRLRNLIPQNPGLDTQLAIALYKAGEAEQAIKAANASLRHNPNDLATVNCLGAALRAAGKVDLAPLAFKKSIALDPTNAGIYANLGVTQKDARAAGEYRATFARALRLAPQDPDAHYNLALASLLFGDFQRGWQEYEWRWYSSALGHTRREFTQPAWNGEDISDKTLLVYCEQGFGDTVHFIRYVRLLKGKARRIIVEVQPALLSLLKDVDGADSVYPEKQCGEPFDVQVALLGLPRLFGTDASSIPAWDRYLSVPEEVRRAWANRLPARRKPRIGLVWSGRPTHANDRIRSVPLERWAGLLADPRFEVLALQPEIRPHDAETLARYPAVINPARDFKSFADTAAVLDQLDLVISVDTSVAHLSAALGRPTWVMIPYCPDWRWLLEGDSSPWYPTMRLFRHASPSTDTWQESIDSVMASLDTMTVPAV